MQGLGLRLHSLPVPYLARMFDVLELGRPVGLHHDRALNVCRESVVRGTANLAKYRAQAKRKRSTEMMPAAR